MSSRESRSDEISTWESAFNRSLKKWVSRHETPVLARGQLLDRAAKRRSIRRWRVGRYWLDLKAAPSFYRSLDQDYVQQSGLLQMHSITMSVQLSPGLVMCT